jgi:hypothetical protein
LISYQFFSRFFQAGRSTENSLRTCRILALRWLAETVTFMMTEKFLTSGRENRANRAGITSKLC